MHLRYRYRALGVFIAALCVFFLLESLHGPTPGPAKPSQYQQSQAAHQPKSGGYLNQNPKPWERTVSSSNGSLDSNRDGKESRPKPDYFALMEGVVSALATVVIAYYAFRQYHTAEGQKQIMGKQVELMDEQRKLFESTEGAYLTFEFLSLGDDNLISDGVALPFGFVFRNVGRSLATDISTCATLTIDDSKVIQKPVPADARICAANATVNQTATFLRSEMGESGLILINRIKEGTAKVFLHAVVSYTDIFQNDCTTMVHADVIARAGYVIANVTSVKTSRTRRVET